MSDVTTPAPTLAVARARAASGHRLLAALTIFLPALAAAAAAAHWAAFGPPPASVLAVTAFMYVATVLGVTAGYHRLFTHRSFEAPAGVRWGLAVAGSMAAQGPLIFWLAEHRQHHQSSDREADPHSPRLGLWHAHVGWMLTKAPENWSRLALDAVRDPVAFRTSAWYPQLVLLGIALPALAAGLASRSLTAALMGALWGGPVRIFLVHHATWSVNSICHRFGARPYATGDDSTNNTLVALATLGEGWHNNHHAFPGSARHGLKTWQIDPTYWLIRTLAAAGLARGVKLPGAR